MTFFVCYIAGISLVRISSTYVRLTPGFMLQVYKNWCTVQVKERGQDFTVNQYQGQVVNLCLVVQVLLCNQLILNCHNPNFQLTTKIDYPHSTKTTQINLYWLCHNSKLSQSSIGDEAEKSMPIPPIIPYGQKA